MKFQEGKKERKKERWNGKDNYERMKVGWMREGEGGRG